MSALAKKRSADDARLDAALTLFDALPIEAIAKILLNAEVLQYCQMALSASTLERVKAAIALPNFFRQLTTKCFPRTTRLPFDAQHLVDAKFVESENVAWRLHLARLVSLFRLVQVRIVTSDGQSSDGAGSVQRPTTCAQMTKATTHTRYAGPGKNIIAVFGGGHTPGVPVTNSNTAPQNPVPWVYAVTTVGGDIVGMPIYLTAVRIAPALIDDAAMDEFIARTASFVQAPARVRQLSGNKSLRVVRTSMNDDTEYDERTIDVTARAGTLFFDDNGETLAQVTFFIGPKKLAYQMIRDERFNVITINRLRLDRLVPPDTKELFVDYGPA